MQNNCVLRSEEHTSELQSHSDISYAVFCFPKSEFALLYFPDSDAHVALNRLNSWIQRCPDLQKALIACNQPRFAKFFSAQAVRLIIEYLGEP